MAGQNERRPIIPDEAQQVRLEVQRQADEANRAADSEAAKLALAQQIKEEFDRQEALAQEAKIIANSSRGIIQDNLKRSLIKTNVAVSAVLEGVKRGVVAAPTPKATSVLKNLADANINEKSAANLYPIVQKALSDPNYVLFSQTGQEKTQFEKDFEMLQVSDRQGARVLSQAVEQVARNGQLEVTEDVVREKLAPTREESETDELTRNEAEESFKRDWEHYYSNFFIDVAKDKPVVEALYVPEKFIDLIEKVEREMRGHDSEFRNLNDIQFKIELSDQVARRITTTLSKIYSRVDQSGPKEFFEQLVQEDPFQGIKATSTRIKSHLNGLKNHFAQYKDKYRDKTGAYLTFYRQSEPEIDVTVTDVDTTYKDEDGNILISEKPKHRLNPQLVPKEVSLADYISYLSVQVENHAAAREYLHNGRAIFYRQPGKDGFYMQLGEFAESIGAVDIDEMNHLPDSGMMLQAFRLYDKFLEEALASNDWKHDPTLFTKKMEELSSRVESEVTDALRAIYSNKNEPDLDARITAARNMAVGYARAVLLTEPEKMAYSDPNLFVGGGASGVSYGVADPGGPMVPFNPLHWGVRWQNQNNLHQLLFMPIDGTKGKDKPHDHNEAQRMMEKYQRSWIDGTSVMDLQGKKLLIDYLGENPGSVGGPLKRGNWRKLFSLEGYYEYKNAAKQELNYLETWKALELVGYEALSEFCVQKIKPKFASPDDMLVSDKFLKNNSEDGVEERNKFFDHLYKTYFTKLTDGTDHGGLGRTSLADYMKELVKTEKKELIDKIRHKEASPKNIDEQAQIEAGRTFLNRTLSRVIAHRMPTKFARMDRDRFSDKGVSRWKKLMYNANLTVDSTDEGASDKDRQWNVFDRAMKDLGIAESMLREKVSEEIRKQIKADQKKRLSGITDIDYKLTEAKVRTFLESIIREGSNDMTAKRVDRAVQVFKALYEKNPGDPNHADFKDPKTGVAREPIIEKEFLNKFRSGDYKFTFAADEIDMSLVGLRGAGPRVLPRALKDIGQVENNVVKVINDYWIILKDVAINGKHDFGPIFEGLKKIKDTMEGVHSPEAAAEVNHHMAAVAINYFKKDTIAKPFFGILGIGRKNSLAAEYADRGAPVWEWDSRVIDKFCTELETHEIVTKRGYNLGKTPAYEPVWVNIPFINKPVKLGTSFKIPFTDSEVHLFEKRVKNYPYTSKELRGDFGGAKRHVIFDLIQTYGPIAIGLILFFLISKAYKETFEKQK